MREQIIPESRDAFIQTYLKYAGKAEIGSEVLASESLAGTLYPVYGHLIEKSNVMNLTSITSLDDVVVKHMIDSLIPAVILRDREYLSVDSKIFDLGSGAGFPALPVAALLADDRLFTEHYDPGTISVYAVEATGKKADHIEEGAEIAGLMNLCVINGRAEDLAQIYDGAADIVLSRALADLTVLVELASRYVRTGGVFAAYKAKADEEINNSLEPAEFLGFALEEIIEYELPSGDGRCLVIYRKTKKTPKGYPRNFGKIKKTPPGQKS